MIKVWRMRRVFTFLGLGLLIACVTSAHADVMPSLPGGKKDAPSQVEVTADQSLEWYQDQHIYVARGNAKAVRGDMVIEADVLTAHERDKPEGANGSKAAKPAKTPDVTATDVPAAATDTSANPAKSSKTSANGSDGGAGDIDRMTAEGHVRLTDPRQRVSGEHAVYDLDQHIAVVTGDNLKYETEKETVTARDSLEYYEVKKMAVARGNAVAVQGDRRVMSDILTAEFRDSPTGEQQLWKMTCIGHVTIVTKTDVTHGDKAVYDIARNIAIITGHVRITRPDGTQLSGDVGEVDFESNQSRLMNDGNGRVRALLTSKTGGDNSPGATMGSPANGKHKTAKIPADRNLSATTDVATP